MTNRTGRITAVTVETEPELEILDRRTVCNDLDNVNCIVPMLDGWIIKLQCKSKVRMTCRTCA